MRRLNQVGLALPLLLLCASATAASQGASAAARPDWPGVWQIEGITTGPSGVLYFSDIGTKNRAELLQGPYNDTWKPRAQAATNERELHPVDPQDCLMGFPDLMVRAPIMFQVIPAGDQTLLLFAGRQVRQVYTDGRAHAPAADRLPTPWGDSIGHWEGDTLVIETVGVTPRLSVSLPQSTQVRYVERLRKSGRDQLEDRITIEDPQAFTHPWTITRHYDRVAGLDRLLYTECLPQATAGASADR